ncbi:MAG: DUF3276 family protein [Saprospiraceae bacterium]|nr:DUF3276 family protein [Saprospiraceae bacterium]MCB0623407.1 DUF3276 family protein [Saprospiraceae bacterium]MCB0677510.1 DUF3276 family protein [Saprospiraceae bacterium]MCB0681095.1 DUF3276 family protein [Saprospiraceae bacterium]
MDNDSNQRRYESVYSNKVKAGKRRTYFFDVRKTKGDDYYLTLTESTKRFNGDGYERHKIFLYKEDFNRFISSLEDAINYVKQELMPDYDYDEFTRRQEEWEASQESGDDGEFGDDDQDDDDDDEEDDVEEKASKMETEDDISW